MLRGHAIDLVLAQAGHLQGEQGIDLQAAEHTYLRSRQRGEVFCLQCCYLACGQRLNLRCGECCCLRHGQGHNCGRGQRRHTCRGERHQLFGAQYSQVSGFQASRLRGRQRRDVVGAQRFELVGGERVERCRLNLHHLCRRQPGYLQAGQRCYFGWCLGQIGRQTRCSSAFGGGHKRDACLVGPVQNNARAHRGHGAVPSGLATQGNTGCSASDGGTA